MYRWLRREAERRRVERMVNQLAEEERVRIAEERQREERLAEEQEIARAVRTAEIEAVIHRGRRGPEGPRGEPGIAFAGDATISIWEEPNDVSRYRRRTVDLDPLTGRAVLKEIYMDMENE